MGSRESYLQSTEFPTRDRCNQTMLGNINHGVVVVIAIVVLMVQGCDKGKPKNEWKREGHINEANCPADNNRPSKSDPPRCCENEAHYDGISCFPKVKKQCMYESPPAIYGCYQEAGFLVHYPETKWTFTDPCTLEFQKEHGYVYPGCEVLNDGESR